MNILDQIVAQKKEAVAIAQTETPLSLLEERIRQRTDRRAFLERLQHPGPSGVNIIAEIKRASPSLGPIRPNLKAAEYARAYEAGGAACLSVLTDTYFFMGSHQDLIDARAACRLPVLRKEFIVSSYQIHESAAMGADAVLLIVRILSGHQLQSYLALCEALHLDALVEIHTEADLGVAKTAGARLIGINNRNLGSFHTDTGTAMRMADQLQQGQIPVAASGIKSRKDITETLTSGIWNFLIGETLVRSDDPCRCLRTLQGLEPSEQQGAGKNR
ncbi:MAG: indole-3-glycerol phosphate synthase TrpC [Desulfobacterales bacterium]|jgi:indole-3-glycerol phosphate synthase|nr:indole-3-glycerol phosphate synthase TrpC [Desulfobacterales bacterium]